MKPASSFIVTQAVKHHSGENTCPPIHHWAYIKHRLILRQQHVHHTDEWFKRKECVFARCALGGRKTAIPAEMSHSMSAHHVSAASPSLSENASPVRNVPMTTAISWRGTGQELSVPINMAGIHPVGTSSNQTCLYRIEGHIKSSPVDT